MDLIDDVKTALMLFEHQYGGRFKSKRVQVVCCVRWVSLHKKQLVIGFIVILLIFCWSVQAILS